jgi:hypothetical protein
MKKITEEELKDVIENLKWAKNLIYYPVPVSLTSSISKLQAMLDEPTEPDTWEQCSPKFSTMVRIGGTDFDFRYESCGDKEGGVINGCFFNERGFIALGVTFHRRKKLEPVSLTVEFQDMDEYQGWYPSKTIDPGKPFTVTFTQNQEIGK